MTRLTEIMILTRDDINVQAFQDGIDYGYAICLGEDDNYRPLLSSGAIHKSASDAISCGEVILQAIRAPKAEARRNG